MIKKLIFFGVIAGVLLLAGCTFFMFFGDLRVVVPIPDSLTEIIEADDVVIEGVSIKLSRSGYPSKTQVCAIDGDEVVGEFNDLSAGKWEIDVLVIDDQNKTLYSGKGVAKVSVNQLTEVEITLNPEMANLEIIVKYPAGLNVAEGVYTLTPIDSELFERYGQLAEVDGSFIGEEESIESGEWEVYVALRDGLGKIVGIGYKTVEVLPGITNTVTIDVSLNLGSVEGYVYFEGQTDHSGIMVSIGGKTVETDSTGYYSITEIASGTYVLTAECAGYYSTSEVVTVNTQETTVVPDLYLYHVEVYGSVSGYAKYLDRTDHSGLGVMIQTMEGEPLPNLIALTAEDGYFYFPQVPVDPLTNETSYIFTAFALNTGLGYSTDSMVVNVIGDTLVEINVDFVLRYAGTEVLIFADDTMPWYSNALSEMLTQLDVSYEVYTSADIPTVNLPLDKIVWIINDQPQEFYNVYAQYQSKFDQFVANGGTMLFEACDEGWNAGSLLDAGGSLPGGVLNNLLFCYTNTVVHPTHPMMTGVDIDLQGSYASHNWFSGFPADYTILTVDEGNNPTLVEYRYNLGRVIATGQPLEYSWYNDQNLKNIYPNMINYTFNLPITVTVDEDVNNQEVPAALSSGL